MKIVDIKGAPLPEGININDCAVLDKMGFPHWGWCLAWLLIFWPACFIWAVIGFTRKHYKVYYKESIYILNEDNYSTLKSTKKEEKVNV